MWRRVLSCLAAPIFALILLLIACDGAPWAIFSTDPEGGYETYSAPSSTDMGTEATLCPEPPPARVPRN